MSNGPVKPFPEALEDLLAPDGKNGAKNKDLFEGVWKIVQECGEEERHFNQLQSVYRGLASTWVLGTLGAVGYLMFGKESKVEHPELLAAVVCSVGALGISLIWVLDLKVYHRLLVAVFKEGKKLEDRFNWLPRFRTNMSEIDRPIGKDGTRQMTGRDPVRSKLAWYYVVTTLVPAAGAIFFLSWYLRSPSKCWYTFCALLVLAALVLEYGLFAWTTDTTREPPE
jgi:hypothetical protein